MPSKFLQDDIILNDEHIERIIRQQFEICEAMSAELDNSNEMINPETIRYSIYRLFLKWRNVGSSL